MLEGGNDLPGLIRSKNQREILSGHNSQAIIGDFTIGAKSKIKYYYVTTGASDVTITLPPSLISVLKEIYIAKIDDGAGDVIISGTINGNASYTIGGQYSGVEIKSISSEWMILNGLPPVGVWYTQYTSSGTFLSAEEPSVLFGGGVWSQEFAGTDGEFFKQVGSSGGQTRASGLQPDQFQGHNLQVDVRSTPPTTQGNVSALGSSSGADVGITGLAKVPTTDGVNGTPRVGSVTEPTNREIKVWKRTS